MPKDYDSENEIEPESENEDGGKRKPKAKASTKTNKKAKTVGFHDDSADDQTDGEEEKELFMAGQIRKIYVENFMNHKKFSMNFGNHLNFVTGKNGSGKSAIAAAIQLCLGGRTTNTGRGKKLSGMIREGSKNPAIIRITLRNEGPDAYEYEKYGNRIIVERNILLNSTSTYNLYNGETSKIVSSSKKDLDKMMQAFSILVDNPVCVLTQEESKKFIKGSASEKYQFFLKASGLQTMADQLKRIEETLENSQENQDKNEKALQDKKATAVKWQEILTQFQAFETIDRDINNCYIKAAYCDVREESKAVEGAGTQLEESQKEEEALKANLDSVTSKQTSHQDKIIEITRVMVELSQESQSVGEQVNAMNRSVAEKTKEVKGKQNEIRDLERSKANNSNQLKEAEKTLQKQRNEAMQNAQVEERGLMEEMQQIDRSFQETQEKEAQLKSELNAFQRDSQSSGQELRDLENKLNSARRHKDEVDKQLRDLTSGTENATVNKLRMFGDKHVSVYKEIQKARWNNPPVGPVGVYFSMVDDARQYGAALERAVGAQLNSYIVNDHQDEQTLRAIFRRNNISFPITTQSWNNRNIANYKPSERIPPNARTVASCLVIKDNNRDVLALCYDSLGWDRVVVVAQDNDLKQFIERGGGGGGTDRPMGDISSFIVNQTQAKVSYKNGNSLYENYYYPYRKLLASDQSEYITQLAQDSASAERDARGYHEALESARGKHREGESRLKSLNAEINAIRPELKERGRRKGILQAQLENAQAASTFDPTPNEEEIEELKVEIDIARQGTEYITAKLQVKEAELKKAKTEKKKLDERKEKIESTISEQERSVEEIINNERGQKNKVEKLQKNLHEKEKAVEFQRGRLEKAMEAHEAAEKRAQNVAVEKLGHEWDGEPPKLGRKDTRALIERAIESKQKEKEVGLRAANLQGHTMETASNNFEKAKAAFKKAKSGFKIAQENLENLLGDANLRRKKRKFLLKESCKKVDSKFNEYCEKTNKRGEVVFDHQEETMVLQCVMDKENVSEEANDVKNLSGGERSFVTFSLLLALGHVIESPFRIMDEYDVFMDEKVRKETMEELMNYTRLPMFHGRQFIAITPNNLKDVTTSNFVRISAMPEPKRLTSHGLQQQTLD